MSPDLQRKKQAIHHALCTVLTEEEAERAANSWAESISTSTSVFNGLNVFARKVCENYGKDGRQRELLLAMNRALITRDTSQVERTVPAAAPEAVPVRAVKIEAVSVESLLGREMNTPEFTSFQPLLLALLGELNRLDAKMGGLCREFLLGVVDNLPWSPAQQDQVVRLINTGATMQTRPYRAGQLKTLMHHLTVWIQEKLGNEIVEDVVRDAIKAVAITEAGMAYSPREFFAK